MSGERQHRAAVSQTIDDELTRVFGILETQIEAGRVKAGSGIRFRLGARNAKTRRIYQDELSSTTGRMLNYRTSQGILTSRHRKEHTTWQQ
jgi:hypothetical protein